MRRPDGDIRTERRNSWAASLDGTRRTGSDTMRGGVLQTERTANGPSSVEEMRSATAERSGDEAAGLVVDPNSGEVAFGEYANIGIATRPVKGQPLSPTTVQVTVPSSAGISVRSHGFHFEKSTPEVARDWHSGLIESSGRDQAAESYRLLRAILNTAVQDMRIVRNPCQIRGAGIERRRSGRSSTPTPFSSSPTRSALDRGRWSHSVGFGGPHRRTSCPTRRSRPCASHRPGPGFRRGKTGAGRVVGGPKSEAGFRSVALSRVVVDALDGHRAAYGQP